MYMSGESLLVILLVGLIAGWLAGKVVAGGGFGIVADIAIGIVGALIGSALFLVGSALPLARDREKWEPVFGQKCALLKQDGAL